MTPPPMRCPRCRRALPVQAYAICRCGARLHHHVGLRSILLDPEKTHYFRGRDSRWRRWDGVTNGWPGGTPPEPDYGSVEAAAG